MGLAINAKGAVVPFGCFLELTIFVNNAAHALGKAIVKFGVTPFRQSVKTGIRVGGYPRIIIFTVSIRITRKACFITIGCSDATFYHIARKVGWQTKRTSHFVLGVIVQGIGTCRGKHQGAIISIG